MLEYILRLIKIFYPLVPTKCPSGYTYREGDLDGVSFLIKNYDEVTMSGCARRCRNLAKCKSFEWSESKMNAETCALMSKSEPDHEKWGDIVFCRKGIKLY